MKSILLSIRPEWLVKILNGDKTIEVRKQFPKDYVGWVYIYCTKDENKKLYFSRFHGKYMVAKYVDHKHKVLNGKVVARFWCDKVSEIKRFMENDNGEFDFAYWDTKPLPDIENIETKSCLTTRELDNYARTKGKIDSVKLNAIHISKLEIFDEPKELGEFYQGFRRKYYKNHFAQDIHKEKNALVQPIKCGYEYTYPLTKAPQNYCYVEE